MNSLSTSQKFYLTLVLVFISLAGFMYKLPVIFRNHDKELHLMFYFSAAAFFNLLYRNKHFLIFMCLLGFSVFIESFQSFSNRFFPRRIHGNFDKEDVYANLGGLILFSVVWVIIKILSFLVKKLFK